MIGAGWPEYTSSRNSKSVVEIHFNHFPANETIVGTHKSDKAFVFGLTNPLCPRTHLSTSGKVGADSIYLIRYRQVFFLSLSIVARLPRYFVPGQPQHIILRGNNRQAIFAAEQDYLFSAIAWSKPHSASVWVCTPTCG